MKKICVYRYVDMRLVMVIRVSPLTSRPTVSSYGRQYLITQIIEGKTLNNLSEQEGLEEASSNALGFILAIVMPELAQLKSRERRHEGFVMPPQWLAADIRPGWKDHR